MPADSTRLQRRTDFTRTLDRGVRVSVRDLTINVLALPIRWPDPTGLRPDVAMRGGPRLGLVVSKKVGNAVVRHAVARRLRHAFAATAGLLPSPDAYVVVRVRPGAGDRSSTDFEKQLRQGFTHRKVVAAFDTLTTAHDGQRNTVTS